MTLSRATDGCLCAMSRGWFSILLVASLQPSLASTAYAGTTTPTVAGRASASALLLVTDSQAPSPPVPCWVVIDEEAHAGKVARRLLLLKPKVDLPCPGLLELHQTSDGGSVLRPAQCRLLRGTDGDTTLCQILDPTNASTFHEGDQFVCFGASSTRGERSSRGPVRVVARSSREGRIN